ncbi:MAG: hypothetical protein AB7C97_05330 [Oscillospiraceae bacterium]
MKKTLFLILALSMVLSCAGCRGYVTTTDGTINGTTTDGTVQNYSTDGTVRDYTTNVVPDTNVRVNDNIINGTRNDLTKRPNARPGQAGSMDYRGSLAY